MTDAIQQQEFVKAMKVLGLVRHSGKKLDMFTVLDSMRNAKMQVFEAATEKGGVRLLKRPLATVKAGTGKALARMGHADDIENVGKVARLYEKLTGVPKTEWNSLMGGVRDTAEVSGRLQGLRAARNTTTVANRFASLTDLTIVRDHKTGEVILDIASVSEDALMNASNLQMADAARMTWDALDEEFTRGSLKGMLTDEGIQQLYDAGMTAQTSSILHDYLSAKMSRLGDDFLTTAGSSDIAELGSARHIYNQIEEAIDRFIQEYSTVVDDAGEVLSWGPKLGDDTAVAKIAEIEELIRELGEAGYDDVAEKLGSFGKFTDVGEWGFVKPKDLKLGGSALEDMVIQRDIANWMRNMATNSMIMNTPVGAAAAKMATNAFMKNWRGMVTLARPTFHIRNAVGAATMNMFMGVKNAQYQRLNRGVHAFRKGMQEAVLDDGTVRSYKEMMDHALSYVDEADRGAFRSMWDEGVLSGYVDTEFRQQIGASAVRPGKWEKLTPWDVDKFVLGKIGASTMQNIEDYARGALFLEFYDEALEGAGGFAREMVNAVHFDYAHLTPAEEFAKSIIPFFVWMRRNIPRQLELMVEQPWMMQRYQHAMTALNDNMGGNEQVPGTSDPMWASANMAGTDIFVGKDTPFWMRVFIDPDLPLGDVQDIPNPLNVNQLTEFANGQLGPHITLITDLLAQRDYNDVNIPAPFNQVLGALSATGLYDTTTDGDVRWSYVQQSLFDLAAPWWGEVVNPLMAGGSDPNDQLRMGQQPGEGWSPQGAITATAWMGARGMGAKLSTPKDTTRDAGFTRAQLEQIAKEMGLYGR